MAENSKKEDLQKLKIIKRIEELRTKGFSEKEIKRFIELDELSLVRVGRPSISEEERTKSRKESSKKYQLANKELLQEKRRARRLKGESLSSEEKMIISLKVKEKFKSIEHLLSDKDKELSQWMCSECEKLSFTHNPFNKKPVYQKDSFICSKCGKEKYFRLQITENKIKKTRKIGTLSIVYRWDKMTDEEKEEIDPMERMGIYCIIFPMLLNVMETFWITCSYFERWDVIEDVVGDEIRLRPISRTEWMYRESREEKSTVRPEYIQQKKHLLNGGMITNELDERLDSCEDDRMKLIEEKRFLIQDLTNIHINELVSVLLEVKRLSLEQSNSEKNRNKEREDEEEELRICKVNIRNSKDRLRKSLSKIENLRLN